MELNLIPRPLHVDFSDGTAVNAPVRKRIFPELKPEGYCIRVCPEEISITGGSEQALLWAENTLAQLWRQFGEELPCLTISDEPAYPIRAFHHDSVRHMLPLSKLKKMVDMASYFKMNTLHWHLSDDQGWRIECRAFPKLHELGAWRNGDHFGTYHSDEVEGGYFTREEIRDFVDYCHQKGLQVIPEIELPGHVLAILKAYPHLSCREEPQEVLTRAGITTEILCAGKEEVYTFLETLLDDVMELFPDPWFHIGGDEAPKQRWEQCPHCRRRMEQEGLTSLRQLQGYMTNRVAAFLRSRGRRTILWNDGAYGGNIDPEVVLQVWFPDQDGALQTHGTKGGKMIFSPVDICYCDYPYGEHPQAAIYNMNLAVPGVPRDAILGAETLHWSEFIRTPERLEELAWPRCTALAEACWCGDDRPDYEDFKKRLTELYPVFGERGIRATPAAGWDPDPEEARRQVAEFHREFDAAGEAEDYDYEALLAQM